MSDTKIKTDHRDGRTVANPSAQTDYCDEFVGDYCDNSSCGFSEVSCYGDLSGSTQRAIPISYPSMDAHFEQSIALMKEVIFERIKREKYTPYEFSQTPALSQGDRRAQYYADGGPGESLMKLWISRSRDKSIHQGHRREAMETMWDLTRDASLAELLQARGAVEAVFDIIAEFCYEPSCKAQRCDLPDLEQKLQDAHIDANFAISSAEGRSSPSSSSTSKDCLSVVTDISLSCFVEQEEIRFLALLSLLNFIKHLPAVMNKLLSDGEKDVRLKCESLCQRLLDLSKCDRLNVNVGMHYDESATSVALRTDNLTEASYELVNRLLAVMQNSQKKENYVKEMQSMELSLTKYNAVKDNQRLNMTGQKRSFIRSTRISIC